MQKKSECILNAHEMNISDTLIVYFRQQQKHSKQSDGPLTRFTCFAGRYSPKCPNFTFPSSQPKPRQKQQQNGRIPTRSVASTAIILQIVNDAIPTAKDFSESSNQHNEVLMLMCLHRKTGNNQVMHIAQPTMYPVLTGYFAKLNSSK